ncbi:MAG: nucleoside-diphosphate-sugar epimerase [Candidatus Azotimanducaceae bacterium]|jgi:nucleoside-diphosphate-sugar epimerase
MQISNYKYARIKIRILVTGIEGFTGRNLKMLLDEKKIEHAGTCMSTESTDAHLQQLDLLDKSQAHEVFRNFKPSHVIHLAGVSNVAHASIDEMFQVNVIGTLNILEAAKDCQTVETVLVASTANLYGKSSLSTPNELTPTIPSNEYGISKSAMEMIAELYKSHFQIIITRPFNYTGVGQSPSFLVPKIVDHFHRRATSLSVGNINVEREFNDVRDIVEIYLRLLESKFDTSPFVVNIGSGRGHTLLSIVEKLSGLTNHRLELKIDPKFVRPNEIPRLVGDTSRLFHHLQGNPFKQSIDSTLEWMLNNA